LDLSERHLGEGHPDLVILLNDLSRLYLKQSAFEYAEPLLLRLLALKRSKGEDHPEVATVLASLASLRQSLGRYDSAEQLWRRVLEIRERTLAPNHFSLATTLEHLATTLAARGKTREGLQLYQRALSIRELTLGSDHPSLRASRERIADLQLQASEDSFAGGESGPTVAAPLRLSPGDRIGMPATATLARTGRRRSRSARRRRIAS
jgi:tetratricopeptide (TPR) repeat protein